ncbi:hypothetical protein M595_5518 [Lyngbya aestuarii BL J]|uniref:Uncharacterized protein n=1 Tax=Lyngbya aestuarii BL J TaxID=1348334 RepID=U7QBH1_9CYAN|nr:hypothetical protein [Lyngbya aestuarii]ERT04537.1 hypothetical protein M595_5518 [Lyngbya aestuarii BL J]
MLGKIWRWLKNWFQRLFRGRSQASQSPPSPSVNPLSDTGYEALFLKVLEGVEQGWEQSQVLDYLGNRINDRFFKSWLQRFGRKLMESPLPQKELAQRMIKFGQIDCGEISEISAELGEMLQQKPTRSLSEAEYQQVFQQVLAGVSLGWEGAELEQFFERLGEQGKPEIWVNWLREYKRQELALSPPNYESSASLLLLGEKAVSVPEWQPFGEIAIAMGNELLEKQEKESIWEYDGLDQVE